jgi:very-short-patch-repair endonuclease
VRGQTPQSESSTLPFSRKGRFFVEYQIYGKDPLKVKRAREFRRKMTPMERRLWERLRANRLGGFHFRRQQVIEGFILGFYCNPVKLVIEVDGGIHELDGGNDAEREEILRSKELRIHRVTNEAIRNNLEAVLERILALCREVI